MLKKSIVLMMFLYSSLNAGAVDSRYFYQDYLDFGANKGKFKAGAKNITIKPQGNSSLTINKPTDITLNAPMIDFSASNQTGILKGEFTNIGANKVITAAHMIFGNQANSLHRYTNLQFGGVNTTVVATSNNFHMWLPSDTNDNNEDFMAMRMNKVNLNKKAEVSPMKFYDESGNDINATACKDNSMCSNKSGKAGLYKENNKETNSRYTIFARSGSGLQMINTVKETKTVTASGVAITKAELEKLDSTKPLSKAGEYFTGGFVQITENNSFNKNYNIHAESFMGNDNYDNELLKFSNTGAKGDSGSALYVYDNVDKKWYVVGVVSSSQCGDGKSECHLTNFHLVDNGIINNFDKAHRVDTSADLTLDATSLKAGALELEKTLGTNSFKHHYDKAANKTIYEQRLDAMEHDKDIYISGGSLTLSADSDLGSSALIIKDGLSYDIKGDFNFLHGGLDVGANSVVNYYAKTAEYDFLHKIGAGKLNVYSSSPNAGLRIGGGEVELLNTDNLNTFGSIYMTNNSSLKINNANQVNTNYLYFGNNAGKLDLNGTSLTLNNFYASDNNAVITNTNAIKSELTINKNLTKDTINHGNIKGNINIVQNNNSSVRYSVYDGGLEVNNMKFKNGNLVFQGHPVVHNYVSATVKSVLGEDVFTSPTRLDQDDWEDRIYKMASLTLNNAKFDILKHSNVDIANINSISSTIVIGANTAYIDRYDGENIKANDTMGSDGNESYYGNLKYQEEVSSGTSLAKNIFIKSDFDLKDQSELSLLNGTNFIGKITADDTSSLDFNTAIINANINASSLNSNNTTYIYESTENALNISKTTSGANNKLLIKKDFLNGAERLLLASLANPTLVGENYFNIEGESSAFATLKPNVKYYNENGTAKWYLEKIGATPPTDPTPTPDPNPTPNPTPDLDDKPQNPDPSNPDNSNSSFDPNPSNNPTNTETPGHYKDYFFVKENVEAIKTAENSLNQIFLGYVLEWNNMQKRMGELRNESSNAGVWLRTFGGKSNYLDVNTTKYYEMQLGADKVSEFNDFTAFAGLLFAHSLYRFDDNLLSGKMKGLGGGFYTSFIFNNGFYVDFIAKYINYKNDYSLNLKNGNQKPIQINANGSSSSVIASLELGNRFYFDKFYLEPSIELISGYVSSITLENKLEHIKLYSKSFIPLNTKIMLSGGKESTEIDKLGFRVGVGLAADLVKNGEKTIRDLNVIRNIKGKKDTRMLTNIAINYNFSNDFKASLEYERTFFGDFNIDHSFNLNIRKTF